MSKKIYEVYNFGPTRDIPYKGHAFNIQQAWGFETSDKGLIKVLRKFPSISIKEVVEKKGPYADMNYFKIKQKAREMGLDIENNIKKKDLIKLMEGVKK